MIFKSIKIGMCIGLGTCSAMITYGAVNGFVMYFVKKMMDKKEKEEKKSAGPGGNFTYKDED